MAHPNKIAVGGHSYGAFMTANLLAHAPHLFCCGIARSGAYNRTLTPFGFQVVFYSGLKYRCKCLLLSFFSLLFALYFIYQYCSGHISKVYQNPTPKSHHNNAKILKLHRSYMADKT